MQSPYQKSVSAINAAIYAMATIPVPQKLNRSLAIYGPHKAAMAAMRRTGYRNKQIASMLFYGLGIGPRENPRFIKPSERGAAKLNLTLAVAMIGKVINGNF